jgi:hypothetical protein
VLRERGTTREHRDAAVQRYYDPGTGQFMSLDPLNQMTNAGYSFVKDNPFGGTDPSGLEFQEEEGGGDGAGVAPSAAGESGGGSGGGTPVKGTPVEDTYFGPEVPSPEPIEIADDQNARTHFVGQDRQLAAEDAPLSDEVAATFRGGQYTQDTLQQDTVVYRAGTAGKPFGGFFSEDAPASEIQTRIDEAIPPFWADGTPAPIDTGYAIEIPAGTTVYEGEVANQGSWYMGGTGQIFIHEPWNIPGAQVVYSWSLQR